MPVMTKLLRALALPLLALGLLLPSEAQAGSRPTRTAHPASQRTKPATGAQRRQTWRNTRTDLKQRFRALGHQMRHKK